MVAMMSMGEMAMMSMAAEKVALANQVQVTPKNWHQSLEAHLELASEPLEAWTLSGHEGGRILEMQDVILSPYWNLK
jgi:hypothetical protein